MILFNNLSQITQIREMFSRLIQGRDKNKLWLPYDITFHHRISLVHMLNATIFSLIVRMGQVCSKSAPVLQKGTAAEDILHTVSHCAQPPRKLNWCTLGRWWRFTSQVDMLSIHPLRIKFVLNSPLMFAISKNIPTFLNKLLNYLFGPKTNKDDLVNPALTPSLHSSRSPLRRSLDN